MEKKGKGIVLFPLPLQGHINPMLQLAHILHSKGYSITIIHTIFNQINTAKYPLYAFHSISDGLSETEASYSDLISIITLLNINCVDPFRICLAKLLTDASIDPIACVITDAILHFTRAVADILKLPRLVLRTGSISSFLAFAAYPSMADNGYIPVPDSELETPVLELPPLKMKDLPLFNAKYTEDLHKLINGMVKETKASSGLIWNSFEELEQIEFKKCTQIITIPNFPIGLFHNHLSASSSSLLQQDQSCISWLNTQSPNSVIYISFGSVIKIQEADFLNIARGLANSKQPFLWAIRPGLVHGSEWIEQLPNGYLDMISEYARIVKWAPQQQVLAHPSVGVFWTHNGWNSTLESICEGVPMLCQPCFGDQMVNARYVADVWRVGLHLENRLAENGHIENAIRRIMVGNEGVEMRDRLVLLKEKINISASPGGSSDKALDKLIDYIFSF